MSCLDDKTGRQLPRTYEARPVLTYRGAHQGLPSRRAKRPREYDSDSDHGPPPRRDDRPRRSEKDREYDRDRDRDRSKERDRPREKEREPRRIRFADGK